MVASDWNAEVPGLPETETWDADQMRAAVEPGRNVGVEVERTRDARAAFRRCPPSQRSCRGAPPRMCSWFRGRIAAARATSWRKAA